MRDDIAEALIKSIIHSNTQKDAGRRIIIKGIDQFGNRITEELIIPDDGSVAATTNKFMSAGGEIRRVLPDGAPCQHKGCLNHISHPCEGCGRIGGMTLTPPTT